MAVVLFQVTDDSARSVSRTRHLHPVDEAQEHAETLARRGFDYTPRSRVLRLINHNSDFRSDVSRYRESRYVYAAAGKLLRQKANTKCHRFCAAKCQVCRPYAAVFRVIAQAASNILGDISFRVVYIAYAPERKPNFTAVTILGRKLDRLRAHQ